MGRVRSPPGRELLTCHPPHPTIVHVDRHSAVDEQIPPHCVLAPSADEHAIVDRFEQVVLNQPARLHIVQVAAIGGP